MSTQSTRAQETKANFDLERRVAGCLAVLGLLQVRVLARQRVVTVSGHVASEYERQTVRQALRRVNGVASVIDHLVVGNGGAALVENWFYSVAMFIRQIDRSYPAARALAVTLLLLVTTAIGGFFYYRTPDDHLPVFPAVGKITYEGRPIADAILVFHPKNGDRSAPRPTARADKEGNFKLTTYLPGDGAPTGEYVVTAEQYPAIIKQSGDVEVGKNTLPKKYSTPIASSLYARIISEGPNQLPTITLSR